jgi:hypothetical protein
VAGRLAVLAGTVRGSEAGKGKAAKAVMVWAPTLAVFVIGTYGKAGAGTPKGPRMPRVPSDWHSSG